MSLDCLFQAPKNCVNQLGDLEKEEKTHTSEDELRLEVSKSKGGAAIFQFKTAVLLLFVWR